MTSLHLLSGIAFVPVREYSAELVFELVNGLWRDHPLRHVSLSRREMSVSYESCDAEEVIVGVVEPKY